MQSVSSNAVARAISYSTTEQLTGGKWIDGKPIYRKMYTGRITSFGANTTVASQVKTTLKIDTVTKLDLIANSDANTGQVVGTVGSAYYWGSNDKIRVYIDGFDFLMIQNGSGYPYLPLTYYVTLEYTKTTD